MNKIIMMSAIVASCLAMPAFAETITTTTTPSGASALIGPGSTQIDFSTVASGTYPSITVSGVTFTANPGGAIYANASYAGQYNTFGQSIANTYAANAFTTLTVTFAAPTNAFGFFFGASDSNWTLTAFNAANAVVGSQVIAPLGSSNAGNFFGITGNGITRATLVQAGSGDYVLLDNFTFGGSISTVPEPATWGLMILGFGATGAMLRRRPTKVSFA